MDPFYLISAVQINDDCVRIWKIFPWHTFDILDFRQLNLNTPGHKAQISWILEHISKFPRVKWPPQSPDLDQTHK